MVSSAALWLSVWRFARQTLTDKDFDEWCFVVGRDGETIERIRRGIFALQKMSPKLEIIAILSTIHEYKSAIRKELRELDEELGDAF